MTFSGQGMTLTLGQILSDFLRSNHSAVDVARQTKLFTDKINAVSSLSEKYY